jgi:hypothetical protein
MHKILYLLLTCSLVALASCAGKPSETLAPCTWENRGNCGKMIPMSHQEQL